MNIEMLDLTGTSPLPTPPEEAPPKARPLSKTMVGMAPGLPAEESPERPNAHPSPAQPHSSLAQTVHGLGLAPVDVQFESEPQPQPKTARFSGTMIGLPARADGGPPLREGDRGRPLGGTLLGVARPGIAPAGDVLPPNARGFSTTPGMAGSPFPVSDSSTPPPGRESTPPGSRRLSASPPTRAKAAWFVMGVLGAAAVGAGIAWLTRPSYSVRVSRFETTAEGGDFIVLECKDCLAKSSVRIGNTTAVLEEGKARISAGKKLAVGPNQIDVLVAPPGGEPEKVSLSVPVAFRVDTSLKELMTESPRAIVRVSAPEGAKVQIQGQTVPLTGGVATLDVPLGDEASGFLGTAEHIEKVVPIVVERDGRPKATEARVSAWIVPLQLTSPAEDHVLSGGPLSVSGRTVKNARVSIGGREVVADLEGEFTLVLDNAKPGPLAIVAREAQSIGRRGTIHLRAEETHHPDALPFSAWRRGSPARIEGTVVEARLDHGTRVVVDVAGGCESPPCLASVAFGEPVSLEPGASISAIGTVVASSPPRLLASSLTVSGRSGPGQKKAR